jgi:hypothetical protein
LKIGGQATIKVKSSLYRLQILTKPCVKLEVAIFTRLSSYSGCVLPSFVVYFVNEAPSTLLTKKRRGGKPLKKRRAAVRSKSKSLLSPFFCGKSITNP